MNLNDMRKEWRKNNKYQHDITFAVLIALVVGIVWGAIVAYR